jgi:hypothetical protein
VEKVTTEADPIFAELRRSASNDDYLRARYAMNAGFLAGAQAHGGNYVSASQILGKMVALDPNELLTYYNAACVLGVCVQAAERDPKLADQQRTDLINEYTDRAMGYLRRVLELAPVASDGDRWLLDKVPTDKDLDPFRTHPEFKRIMAEIKKLPERAPAPRLVK